MSLRALESAITQEARELLRNKGLRVKDLMEWSTGQLSAQEGEVTVHLPRNGVWIAVKRECDRRGGSSGGGT